MDVDPSFISSELSCEICQIRYCRRNILTVGFIYELCNFEGDSMDMDQPMGVSPLPKAFTVQHMDKLNQSKDDRIIADILKRSRILIKAF